MNGMTQKELEKEKMLMGRMCFELKAKRQVSRGTRGREMNPRLYKRAWNVWLNTAEVIRF